MSQIPLINLMDNFDAKLPYQVFFTYLGSNKILSNTLSIRESKNQSVAVYESTATQFDKSHTIPAGALTNGLTYKAKVQVTHEGGDVSEWSPEIEFLCLATPNIVFDNLDEKHFVYNDDIMMTAIYRQEQGERVTTYQFVLMNQNKVPVTTFPVRIPLAGSPTVFTERISGLVKGRLYYIGCRVVTRNGLNYFALQEFIPQYIAPSIAGILEAHNQNGSGQVLVQAYLKQLLGTQAKAYIPYADNDNDDNYAYIGGEKIVIPPQMPLVFTRLGMAKASDFVVKVWCTNVLNGVMLDFSHVNGGGSHIRFIKQDDRIICEKELNGVVSRTRSNIVPNLGLKEFYLYIKVIEFRVQMLLVEKAK